MHLLTSKVPMFQVSLLGYCCPVQKIRVAVTSHPYSDMRAHTHPATELCFCRFSYQNIPYPNPKRCPYSKLHKSV